jgi:hypothetical protein
MGEESEPALLLLVFCLALIELDSQIARPLIQFRCFTAKLTGLIIWLHAET